MQRPKRGLGQILCCDRSDGVMGGRGSSGGGGGGGAVKVGAYSGPKSYSDLPNLQGSEKQVNWANKIRKEMLNDVISTAQDTIYQDDGTIYPKYVNSLSVPGFAALSEVFSPDAVLRVQKEIKKETAGMSPKEASGYIENEASALRSAISTFQNTVKTFTSQTSAKWWIENRNKRYSRGDKF